MVRVMLLAAWGISAGGRVEASPVVDEEVFGKMLGGWSEKKDQAARYEISGATYRTWKPHVTPTLDGGIFISVRIDHLRGILASNDHASLELAFDGEGNIATARSTIALQGRKISSDLIRSGGKVGGSVMGAERVVKVGTDLIADLSSKLLNEKISEPGRVGFPAVLRHNYNLLCLSVRNMENRAVPANGEVLTPARGLAVPAVPVEDVPMAGPEEAGRHDAQTVPTGPGEEVEGEDLEGEEVQSGRTQEAVRDQKEGEEERRAAPPLEVRTHGVPKTVELPVKSKG